MKIESENSTPSISSNCDKRTCCWEEDGDLGLLISEALQRASDDIGKLQQVICRWEEEELSQLTDTNYDTELKAQMSVKLKVNNYLERFFAKRRATVEWCTATKDVGQEDQGEGSSYLQFPNTDFTVNSETFVDSTVPGIPMAVLGLMYRCEGQSPTTLASHEGTYNSMCSVITDIVYQAAKDVQELKQSICLWEAEEQSKLSADEDDATVQCRVNHKLELYLESYFAERRAREEQSEENYLDEDSTQKLLTKTSLITDTLGSTLVVIQDMDTPSTELTNKVWPEDEKLPIDTVSLAQELSSFVSRYVTLEPSEELSENYDSHITDIVCQAAQDVHDLKQTICRWEEEERSRLEPDVDESIVQSRVSQKVEWFLQIYFSLRRSLTEPEGKVKIGEHTFTEKDLRGPLLQFLIGFIEQNQSLEQISGIPFCVSYDKSSQTFDDSHSDANLLAETLSGVEALPQDVNPLSASHTEKGMEDTSKDISDQSQENTDVYGKINEEEHGGEESEKDREEAVQSSPSYLQGTDSEDVDITSGVREDFPTILAAGFISPTVDIESSLEHVSKAELSATVTDATEDTSIRSQTSDICLEVNNLVEKCLDIAESPVVDTETFPSHLQIDEGLEVVITCDETIVGVNETEFPMDVTASSDTIEEGKAALDLQVTALPVTEDATQEASFYDEKEVTADASPVLVQPIGANEGVASEDQSCTGEDICDSSEKLEDISSRSVSSMAPQQTLDDQDTLKNESVASHSTSRGISQQDLASGADEVVESISDKSLTPSAVQEQSPYGADCVTDDPSRQEQCPMSWLFYLFLEDDEPFMSCLDSESSQGQSTSPQERPTLTPVCSPQDTLMSFSPPVISHENRVLVTEGCIKETTSDLESVLGQSLTSPQLSGLNVGPMSSNLPDFSSTQFEDFQDRATEELEATHAEPESSQLKLDENSVSPKILLREDDSVTQACIAKESLTDSETGPSVSSSKEQVNISGSTMEIYEPELISIGSYKVDDAISMAEESIGKVPAESGTTSCLPSPSPGGSTSAITRTAETSASLSLASSVNIETFSSLGQVLDDDVEKNGPDLNEPSQEREVVMALVPSESEHISDVGIDDKESQMSSLVTGATCEKVSVDPDEDREKEVSQPTSCEAITSNLELMTKEVPDLPLTSVSRVIFSGNNLNATSIDSASQTEMYLGPGLSDSLQETSTRVAVGSVQQVSKTPSDLTPRVRFLDNDENVQAKAAESEIVMKSEDELLSVSVISQAKKGIWRISERNRTRAFAPSEGTSDDFNPIIKEIVFNAARDINNLKLLISQCEVEETSRVNASKDEASVKSRVYERVESYLKNFFAHRRMFAEQSESEGVGRYNIAKVAPSPVPSKLPEANAEIPGLCSVLPLARSETFAGAIAIADDAEHAFPQTFQFESEFTFTSPPTLLPDIKSSSIPSPSRLPSESIIVYAEGSLRDTRVFPALDIAPGESIFDETLPGQFVPYEIVPGVSVPDVSVLYVSVPDLSVPDVSVPEVPVPDVSVPDGSVPDVSVPDGSVPDVSVSDVPVPDVSVPDVSVPDVSVPDVPVPDVSVPNVSVPDVSVPDVSVPNGSSTVFYPLSLTQRVVDLNNVSVVFKTQPASPLAPEAPAVLEAVASRASIQLFQPSLFIEDDAKSSYDRCSNHLEGIIKEDSGEGLTFSDGTFLADLSESSTPATLFLQLPQMEHYLEVQGKIDSKLSSPSHQQDLFIPVSSSPTEDQLLVQCVEEDLDNVAVVNEDLVTQQCSVSSPVPEETGNDPLSFEGMKPECPSEEPTQEILVIHPVEACQEIPPSEPLFQERHVFSPSQSEDDQLAPISTALTTSPRDIVTQMSYPEEHEEWTYGVDTDSFGGQSTDATTIGFIKQTLGSTFSPNLPEVCLVEQQEVLPTAALEDMYDFKIEENIRVNNIEELRDTPLHFTNNPGMTYLEETCGQVQLESEVDGPPCVDERSSEPVMLDRSEVSPLMEMKKDLNIIMRQFFDSLTERNLRDMSFGIDNLMVKEQLVSMCLSVLEMATKAFVSLANCSDTTDVLSSPASFGSAVTHWEAPNRRTPSNLVKETDQNFKMFLVDAICDLVDEDTSIKTSAEIKDGILNTVTDEVNCILSETIQDSLHSRHSGTNFCQMSTCKLCRRMMARVAREIKVLIKGRRTKKMRPSSSSKGDLYPSRLLETNLASQNITEVSIKDSVSKKIKRFWGQLKCKE